MGLLKSGCSVDVLSEHIRDIFQKNKNSCIGRSATQPANSRTHARLMQRAQQQTSIMHTIGVFDT